MSQFLPTSRLKWVDTEDSDLNEYTKFSSKGCILEVYGECLKKPRELHNDYLLAQNKTEIKRETLSDYQQILMIYTMFLLVILKS